MQFFQKHSALILGALACVFLVVYSCSFPFFWDTVQLGSKQANWFFSNGLNQFLLPEHINSGHFPLFGLMLALVWTVFGKSLLISHLFMIPFLLLIVHFTLKVGTHFTDEKFKSYFLLLVFCNPYFLGQAVLVSSDVVLMAFFVMCLYGILNENKLTVLIAAIGLSLISMRGLVLVLVLLIWLLYRKYYSRQGSSGFLWLLPGIGFALTFQSVHFFAKGWVVYHPGSPWMHSYTSVYQIGELMRNTGVFIWRLIDFGNVFHWLALLILLVIGLGRKNKIISLLLLTTLVFASITIPKVGLLNHRYYLPIIYILICVVVTLIYKSEAKYKKSILLALCVLSLAGNLWKYPDGTAQGWDSTLAHLPYYGLFEEAISFLDENGYKIEKVGTAFPAKNKLSDLYLNDDHRSLKNFDLYRDSVILYSNVMNDFDTEHIFELDNLWKPVFHKKRGSVVLIIFEKK